MTQGRRERADAARNRRAILLATEDLLTRHRPEEISMERVAAAAGVGKGTLFHRFGSRMGLMRALMEERAVALRASVESGPPPLGPGAPPRERLFTFLDGIVDVVSRNKGLVAALGHAASTAHRAPARKTRGPGGAGDAAEERSREGERGQEPEQLCAVPRGRPARETEGPEGQEGPEEPAGPKGSMSQEGSEGPKSSADSGGPKSSADSESPKSAADSESPKGSEGRAHSHDHPVYDFWHAHISALITAERPDADAELLAHLLLSPLYSEHIQSAFERGEGARVARALRATAGAMLDAPPDAEARKDS